MAEKKQTGTVLVAGAGISGIRAAIELAEIGYKVLLTDSSPQIGGILAKLDNQFPTDHCGMCRMLPIVGREYASQYCMRKGLFHENIEILPFTELLSLEGDVGKFSVELLKKARYVDTDRCNGLGECIEVCPVEVDDQFNHGLTRRRAIYQPVPHSTPQMLLVDMEACTRCNECVKVCPTNVIDLDAVDSKETRQVHAVILASGVKLYNTTEFEDARSYAVSDDVVTSLAFERIISGTGTYNGEIRRPSDGKPAGRIAWIQCMGSRNRRQDRDYCSSICCMFALKEAVLAREKGSGNVETTIFYMDMRAFGKGFHKYREEAVEKHGVKLVRCRVQDVMLNPDKTLSIRYFDPETNEFFNGTYDMVVLSAGQIPYDNHKTLADLLNIEVASNRLLPTEEYEKVKLTKPGVFLCGSLMGLTDISEAMSSGIAAAGAASTLLSTLDVATANEEAVVEPTAPDSESPAVAVVLCRCAEKPGTKGVDFKSLAGRLERLHCVREVSIIDTVCSDRGMKETFEILEKSSCNRLIIGACLPFTYRPTLKNLAKKAGFASSLTDIFDLSSLVHAPGAKTDIRTGQAFDEVKSAVENLKLKPALHVDTIPINQAALIVGGGIAGMHAALSLAGKNVAVHLIEQSDKLGGYAGNHVKTTIDNLDPISMADQLKAGVLDNKNITVHLNAQVVSTEGNLGSFETTIHDCEKEENRYLHHGAAIIATGAREGYTGEYEYGNSNRILTQSELKKGLDAGTVDVGKAENIVMIQCVGSREKEKRNYCSRICCIGAIENALAVKRANPEVRIFVLYRDVMTYGFAEQYYTKARAAGIVFVNYTLDNRPKVEIIDGIPGIKFKEPVLDSDIELSPDLIVLSTGVDPESTNPDLGKAFNVPINDDGFFVEADVKFRPVEFQKVGIYLAGTAHSPMPLKDVVLQAEAAAQKACTYLSGRTIHSARVISRVRHALCVRCHRCVDICPYTARSYDQVLDRIVVDGAACQACGMCAVACQNNAAEVLGWSDRQIMAVIDTRLSGNPLPAAVDSHPGS